ncbi:hypothetical protein, partial [Anaeromyxobacter oryzisoli]|uniref:hypothetical protein n=1 Tax=Anaeromyxobacter oryzisoli TaxID=2925408 RepID=UPI001F55CE2F
GRPRAVRIAAALSIGAAVALALVAPEVARRGTPAREAELVPTYPALGEWGDRAANVVRGVLHDVPAPPAVAALVDVRLPWRAAALVPGWPQTVPHEDFAGNPLQAVAIAAALLAAAARSPRVPRRGRWAMAGAASAWILFHLILRDNEYLTRLQLPLFALAPVFLAAVPRTRRRRARLAGTAALVACVVLAVCWAGAVALSNRLRPPLAPRSAPPFADYYRNGPLLREPQLTTLDVARSTGCRRLGLFMGESGFEYPLAWQALQQGVEVRHVFGADAWPCLVYVEPISFAGWGLRREPVALARDTWRPVAANAGGVYLFERIEPGDASRR